MPDDFQAQPPPADNPPVQGAQAYERFEQVDLRKPENQGSVRLSIIALGGIFAVLAVVLAIFAAWLQARMSVTPNTAPILTPGPGGPFGADPELLGQRKALEGTWVATAMIVDGKKVAQEEVNDVSLTVDANGFSMALPDSEQEGGIALSPLSPEHINFIVRAMPDRQAIYRINEQMLTICMHQDPSQRPMAFTAEEGSGRTLIVFKRQEKRP